MGGLAGGWKGQLRRATGRGCAVVALLFMLPSLGASAQQSVDRCEVLGRLQEKDVCQLDLVQPSNLGVYVKMLFAEKASFDADTVEFFFPGHPPGAVSEDKPWSIFVATKDGAPVEKLLEMSGDWAIETASGVDTLVLRQDGRAVFKFEYPLIYGLPRP